MRSKWPVYFLIMIDAQGAPLGVMARTEHDSDSAQSQASCLIHNEPALTHACKDFAPLPQIEGLFELTATLDANEGTGPIMWGLVADRDSPSPTWTPLAPDDGGEIVDGMPPMRIRRWLERIAEDADARGAT